MKNNPRFVFFGTSAFARAFLETLKEAHGMIPSLIVTTPDEKAGRDHHLQKSPVKEWAEENDIDLFQPAKLRDPEAVRLLKEAGCPLFVVAAYGKILPKEILDIPEKGCLNIHGSILPAFRGSSPIQNQILSDIKSPGISIILMDEEVDHGPVLATHAIAPNAWPLEYSALESELAKASADLFASVISKWITGELKAEAQDHSQATFTKMIEKKDGQIDLAADAYANYLKYLAYKEWPGTFFFAKRKGRDIRVVIKKARFDDGAFLPERVVPEGKGEMEYASFQNGLN